MKLERKKFRLNLKKNAFPFQQDAFDIIKNQKYFAVFHEQGLGKTKIAIDLSYFWLENEIVDSVLIVTKKSLINNWIDELEFHGNMPPIVFDSNKAKNFHKFSFPGYLYLTNYELIRDNKESFMRFIKHRKVGIILDESTQIKNPSSKTSKSLHYISSECIRRIIMTGTPISNRPYDMWSQIFFLDLGERLGESFEDFKENYDLNNDLNNNPGGQIIFKNNLSLLNQKLSDCSLRETKKTAGLKLPGKSFIAKEIAMDNKQQILYKKIQQELSAIVLKNGKFIEENVESVLKRLIRLVQISSNPALVDQSYSNVPPKLKATEEIVQNAVEQGSKVIIWTNFVENVDLITNYFKEYGAVGISGNVDNNLRNTYLSDFRNNESIKLLIATPGVAREGLTLVEANHAIFFDRNFSLENYLQAQDRIYRISQKKECFIYKLLAINSIDYWVDSLLEAKEISARYAQGDITKEDYEAGMSFDFFEILKEILAN